MPAGFDPFTLVLFAIGAVLIFFMFRNGRKAKAAQEEIKKQIVPGANIMTNFGLFGTLISVDEVSNEAEVEVAPGTIVRVHRQTLAKVVAPVEETGEPRSVEEAMELANREYEASQAAAEAETATDVDVATDPATSEAAPDTTTPVKKTSSRTSKKASE